MSHSRRLFEQCRRDVARHAEVVALIDSGGRESRGVESVHVSGGLPSSPTESKALWNITVGDALLDSLRAERDRLDKRISYALRLLEIVRSSLGDGVAGIVEMYYLKCRPWDSVSEEYRISTRHCRRIRDLVFRWLDEWLNA